MKNILEVEHLKTFFSTHGGIVKPVRDVSFHLQEGEILGIVGESGSGKSVSMFSVMGLLAKNGYIGQGTIRFDGEERFSYFPDTENVPVSVLRKRNDQYRNEMMHIRGRDIGMIFQDPMTYLNPILTIGYQMSEGLKKHFHLSNAECKKRNIEMLEMVGITNPDKRLKQYPFELSGGMRQRIMIAIALNNKPKLLIADEPTTALDVTIQAQILELMKDLQKKMGMSIILITHDLGVVASMCTRILIMYGGQIMEQGTDREIFYASRHPYTEGLLHSVANIESSVDGDEQENDGKTAEEGASDLHTCCRLTPIEGSPPDLLSPPKGCAFVDRCRYAMRVCKEHEPPRIRISETHDCKCWLCDADVEKLRKGE